MEQAPDLRWRADFSHMIFPFLPVFLNSTKNGQICHLFRYTIRQVLPFRPGSQDFVYPEAGGF